jgi:hypothetical protein
MGLLDRSKFAGRESYAEPFDLPWKDDDPGEGWPRSPPAWMALHSSLWLPDEPGIETNQEDNEMDDGPATADLRCFDKTCPQQRHRNIGEIEIEQDT